MHYHGYRFKKKKDKFDPNAWKDTIDFLSSDTAPDRCCWALLKPASIAKGPWDSAEEALQWLLREYEGFGPEAKGRAEELRFFHPDRRPEQELKALRVGNDVVRSIWLKEGGGIELWIVCCPNAWETNPCPLGRTDTRPEGATKGGN